MAISISPAFRPPLDPGFVPAALWNRAYRAIAANDPQARDIELALSRADGTAFRWSGKILAAGGENDALTLRYLERLVKFLLWQKGGSRLAVAGAPEVSLRSIRPPAHAPSIGSSSAANSSANRCRWFRAPWLTFLR
jgi:hypothetical protein